MDNKDSLKERLLEKRREKQEFGRMLSEIEREQERYKKLKREEFLTLEGEKLLQAASAWIYEKTTTEGLDKYAAMMAALPKPCQVFYAAAAVDCEVNNGGFNQYYFNLGNEVSTVSAYEALVAIGAVRIAGILKRADQVHEQIKGSFGNCSEEWTMEGFMGSYEGNPLNAFDDEFQEAYEVENLGDLSVEYIRANIDCFGD